jgi:hypothetical protein
MPTDTAHASVNYGHACYVALPGFFFMPLLISVIMVEFNTAGRNVVHSERPLLTFHFPSPNLSKFSLHCYYTVCQLACLLVETSACYSCWCGPIST